MRRSKFLALTFLCSALSLVSRASDLSDSAAAQSVLGPQWKHLSRRAGMIFAGTVLSSAEQLSGCESKPDGVKGACPISPAIPNVELRFRVDLPIAGVESGKTLTIHQWTGALARQRRLHPGDRILLLLYPPSRLGFTSPVAGSQGQVRLDSSGQHVKKESPSARPIAVKQLARAIRAARGE